LTGSGVRSLDLPCGEQGKLPTAKAFKLAERDKFMSEQEKPKSFMEKLDEWTETVIFAPLAEGATEEFWEEFLPQIKKAIRTKMLESYRNGQKAGPRPAQPSTKGGR
jgi:hypothetical protein